MFEGGLMRGVDRSGVGKRKRRRWGKSASRLKLEGDTGSAWVAQLVERVLGKDEVTGSIPVPGSRDCEARGWGKSLQQTGRG